MNRWLFKTDPETYSWNDLTAKKEDVWDGVANPLALKHLRSVKKGDAVLIYHSGEDKAVMGLAEASSAGYPDPKDKSGKLALVDLKVKAPLKNPVSLSDIKKEKKLASWELVRMSRLSVMPVTEEQWQFVMRKSESAG